MKTCPFCKQAIPVEARECKFCHRVVVRACPYCAEEIYIAARICRHCSQDVSAPPPGGPGAPGPGPAAPAVALRQLGPVGEERNVVLWLVLSIFTACIAPLVWMYLLAQDINRHGGRDRLNPVLDIVLTFLTCGFWALYVYYKYADAYCEIVREEGGEVRSDLPVLCLIIGFFISPVALLILQNELNEHWKKHVGPQYAVPRAQ